MAEHLTWLEFLLALAVYFGTIISLIFLLPDQISKPSKDEHDEFNDKKL